MTNKNKIFLVAVVAVSVLSGFIGGVIWISKIDQRQVIQKQQQIAIEKTIPNVDKEETETATTIKDGYKNLRVSNGSIAFSFQIPQEWETETRNSGEVPMTREQKISFLNKRDSESSDEVDSVFSETFSDGLLRIPNASVLKSEINDNGYPFYIRYGDWNGNQINFHILKDNADLVYSKNDKLWCYDKRRGKCVYENIKISGIDSKVIKIGLDEEANYIGGEINGKNCSKESPCICRKEWPCVTKFGPGGTNIFIPLDNATTVVIEKQALGDDQFENDFNYLIQTLKFEKK